MSECISREVRLIVSKLGDEIELEIIQYEDHYRVVATICDDHPPFRDFIAFGESFHSRLRARRGSQQSKMKAIKMALTDLYRQVYSKKS